MGLRVTMLGAEWDFTPACRNRPTKFTHDSGAEVWVYESSCKWYAARNKVERIQEFYDAEHAVAYALGR